MSSAYRITGTPRLSYSPIKFRSGTHSPIKVTVGRPCGFLPSWQSFTPFFHHSAFQKFLNQLNDPLILHGFPQKVQQFSWFSVSKYLLKSSCTAHSYLHPHHPFEDGILRTSSWPVAIAPFRKLRFIQWYELLSDCLLHNPVARPWESQRVLPLHPASESPSVSPALACTAASDCFGHFFAVFLEPWKRFFYGHSVHSRRSLVCLYPLVSPVRVVSVQDCFQLRFCNFCLPFHRFPGWDDSALPHIPFAFRAISLRAASDVSAFFMPSSFLRLLRHCIGSALPFGFPKKVLWLRLTSARSARP